MTIDSNRCAGARADFRRDDFIIPRVRSDREWCDLEKAPRMESMGEQIAGVLLMGVVGAAALVIIVNLVRIFA